MSLRSVSIISAFLLLLISCSKSPAPAPTPTKSSEKNILSFSFLKEKNAALDADYIGTISGTTVSVAVPYGVDLTQLKASFTLSAGASAKVGNTVQSSGVTANDFTNPVTYTITAEDNSTVNNTVTVTRSGIAPNNALNAGTSIAQWNTNYLRTDLSMIVPVDNGYWGDKFAAQAFYDFDKDGDKDLICATINFDANVALDIHYYKNNGGIFTKDQSVFGANVPKFVHARQIILGDFDKNGWMDVVFAAHGFDKTPFPGEQQRILFNTNGAFTAQDIPLPKSNNDFTFNHSVCAGDIDNDGDLDLFFTNNMRLPENGFFMKNNGNGTFVYDATIFPGNEFKNKPCFTSSLYDIDNDGYLDLVIAGHDRDQNITAEQGQKPTILWGNSSGKYTASNKTELPVVANYGVSNSITFLDYDKDGKTDIVIGKTGDGAAGSLPFYQGYYLQLLKNNGARNFIDASSAIANNATTTGKWVVWFITQDLDGDGDSDIATGDTWYNLQWRNNGGTFAKY